MVTASTLREGSWYALEQAGRLLHAAVDIYDRGDLATALGLAMFGREEIGRSRILWMMAEEVEGGRSFSVTEVNQRCENHVTKQEEGILGMTIRVGPEGGLAAAARARITSAPGSAEWQAAREAIQLAADKKRKRDPHDRHRKREEALYVDLQPDGNSWSRPCAMANDVARTEIEDAVNDYSHLRLEADASPTMAKTRSGMNPLPSLPEPGWPPLEPSRSSIRPTG